VVGGRGGRPRVAGARDPHESNPRAGLVFGARIRTFEMGEEGPGLRPLSAALEDEGFDDLGSGKLVESFARHFMVAVDAWQEQGFGAVAKNYLGRLSPESGMRREIAENGDLLVRRMATSAGGPERRALLHALGEPSWLDPATGGPRRRSFCAPFGSIPRTLSCSSVLRFRASGRSRGPSASRRA